jgi:hypothetical protein
MLSRALKGSPQAYRELGGSVADGQDQPVVRSSRIVDDRFVLDASHLVRIVTGIENRALTSIIGEEFFGRGHPLFVVGFIVVFVEEITLDRVLTYEMGVGRV